MAGGGYGASSYGGEYRMKASTPRSLQWDTSSAVVLCCLYGQMLHRLRVLTQSLMNVPSVGHRADRRHHSPRQAIYLLQRLSTHQCVSTKL